ncbi:MAG: hypothetical protein A2X48_04925 [Lentisphaerae bacterium GWF2_49_21]|nr:MAG: hypothetical protein A2X48_04925 [Lentisphaerae bacterium GWF2_49_21]
MKYIALIIFIFGLLIGSGCTSVKKVPMLTMEEDQQLLELAKSRNDKNNKDRIVIGVSYVKDEEMEKHAEDVMTYFLMTDYVKEINYSHLLKDDPDFLLYKIEPCHETSITKMVTIPFYILSIGVIPMYTPLEWGYNFNLKPAGNSRDYPVVLSYNSHGLAGWLCLLINWLPGWGHNSITGDYQPLEVDIRLILELEGKKQDIFKLRSK